MIWHIATMAAVSAGSFFGPSFLGMPINICSSDPMVRMEQMMIDSENLRQMHEEWRQVTMARGGVGFACIEELSKMHFKYHNPCEPRMMMIELDDLGMWSNQIRGGRAPVALQPHLYGDWPSFDDRPSHLTPYRIHGGVGPASSSI